MQDGVILRPRRFCDRALAPFLRLPLCLPLPLLRRRLPSGVEIERSFFNLNLMFRRICALLALCEVVDCCNRTSLLRRSFGGRLSLGAQSFFEGVA